MKELLLGGAMVLALALTETSPVGNECETSGPRVVQTTVSEGFVPHERVTAPPVRESVSNDGLLPDFGSEAYL